MSTQWHAKRGVSWIAAFAGLVAIAATAPSSDAAVALTPKAEAAVKAAFPQGVIAGVGAEAEQGVQFFEVALKLGERKLELEVTADGILTEIEEVVQLAALPKAVAEAISKAAGGGKVLAIERHEFRGYIKDGRAVALDKTVVQIEAKLLIDGQPASFRMKSVEPVKVPEAVLAAVKAAFPKAEVVATDVETEDGVKWYDLTLKQGDAEMKVEVTAEGVIGEAEKVIPIAALPKPVADTVAKVADGKVQPLDAARVVYEVDLVKGDLQTEVQVAANGDLLRGPKWQKSNGDDEEQGENEDGGDNQEDED